MQHRYATLLLSLLLFLLLSQLILLYCYSCYFSIRIVANTVTIITDHYRNVANLRDAKIGGGAISPQARVPFILIESHLLSSNIKRNTADQRKKMRAERIYRVHFSIIALITRGPVNIAYYKSK